MDSGLVLLRFLLVFSFPIPFKFLAMSVMVLFHSDQVQVFSCLAETVGSL